MPDQTNRQKCLILERLTDLVYGGQCNPLKELTVGQLILLIIFAISLVGSLLCGIVKLVKLLKYRSCEASNRFVKLCWNLTQLGLIFTYMILCDKGKIGCLTENSFSNTRFWTVLAVLLLPGLLTISKNPKPSLLDVNITTEIKGWMQMGILAYHYTNAYYVLPIFIVIRLFVTMYVTLSAYGHFCYYWKKSSSQNEELMKHSVCRRAWIFSRQLLYRYIQVLFRMNILVVLLCVVFRQPYMKYYFVPLITTAYTLSAATMTAWILLLSFVESSSCQRLKSVPAPASNWALIRRIKATRDFVETYRNDSCFLLVLSAAFLYSHLLHTSDWLFSLTFFKSPLKYLFGPATGQWKYRWSIDGYSTVLGLTIGYAVTKWKEFRQQEQNHENSLKKDVVRLADYYRIPKLILTCLKTTGSSVALITYVVFAAVSTGSGRKYTDLHPHIMSAGVIAILVLRNSSELFRKYYSKFFVWVGQFALELFVTQYHMWITGRGGASVIAFIPNYKPINFVLTTAIFFGCCRRIHEITQWLTSFLFP